MNTGNKTGTGVLALMPILFGFFVMGFADIIGVFKNRVTEDLGLSGVEADFLPMMLFVWFFLMSIPAGVMTSRIGRKNTVLVSLFISVVAMILPFAVYNKVSVYASFALLGIGNTIIQAALPALMRNVTSAEQLASRLSMGQFVKAVCGALTPVLATQVAIRLGNWKLMFPIYAGITLLSAVWLLMTPVRREEPSAQTTTFGGCLALLGNPFILAMFSGIFFVVGVDVGFNCAIMPYLKATCGIGTDAASIGPTVYFVSKTIGAFLGAIILAKFSPAKCFPLSASLAFAGTVALLFVGGSQLLILSCFAVASFGIANIFGMVFGQAMNRVPEKTNEAAGLMVMAIAGGGVLIPLMGALEAKIGPSGLVYVLLGCLAYLIGLGVFVAKQAQRKV
ncbi:MAG: MFS transporter [Kiritimatiellaeota bacterium]|nr:MFS transporter [Kiritimatiellota bacterium]